MTPVLFGRYVLLERLARGGMGEVFAAVPRGAWTRRRLIALKRILPLLSQDPEFLARFRDEVRLVIPLQHPNVVRVLEVGQVDESCYIAMELVDGANLAHLLDAVARGAVSDTPVNAALFVVRELLAALSYCHRQTDSDGRFLGVVHRDVSPSNLLISSKGEVKLADFGLAISRCKMFQTQPDVVLGHMGYMAPEGMDGLQVDQRADVFCAGILLYELLTGRRLAPGNDPVVVRRLLHRAHQLRPSAVRRNLPAELDQMVQRALAEHPEDRYPDACAFQQAVNRVLFARDALYGPSSLVRDLLQPSGVLDERPARLRRAVAAMELEDLPAPGRRARTRVFGERIPLTAAGEDESEMGAPLLTLVDRPPADTEPMPAPPRATRPRWSRSARGTSRPPIRWLEADTSP